MKIFSIISSKELHFFWFYHLEFYIIKFKYSDGKKVNVQPPLSLSHI